MSGIMTPAMESLQTEQLLPAWALEFANGYLIGEGINPLEAFNDDEVNRHHRAIALGEIATRQEDEPESPPGVTSQQPHPFLKSTEGMRQMRQKYPGVFI